jgi:hypothetical protein
MIKNILKNIIKALAPLALAASAGAAVTNYYVPALSTPPIGNDSKFASITFNVGPAGSYLWDTNGFGITNGATPGTTFATNVLMLTNVVVDNIPRSGVIGISLLITNLNTTNSLQTTNSYLRLETSTDHGVRWSQNITFPVLIPTYSCTNGQNTNTTMDCVGYWINGTLNSGLTYPTTTYTTATNTFGWTTNTIVYGSAGFLSGTWTNYPPVPLPINAIRVTALTNAIAPWTSLRRVRFFWWY